MAIGVDTDEDCPCPIPGWADGVNTFRDDIVTCQEGGSDIYSDIYQVRPHPVLGWADGYDTSQERPHPVLGRADGINASQEISIGTDTESSDEESPDAPHGWTGLNDAKHVRFQTKASFAASPPPAPLTDAERSASWWCKADRVAPAPAYQKHLHSPGSASTLLTAPADAAGSRASSVSNAGTGPEVRRERGSGHPFSAPELMAPRQLPESDL
jgi:hypothetical protein